MVWSSWSESRLRFARFWSRSRGVDAWHPAVDVGPGVPEAGNHLELAPIYALSPDGPSYDEAVGSEVVSAPENFLILCPTHHHLVDASPAAYTATRLNDWRADAFAWANARLFTRPTPGDGESILHEALETWERERRNGDEVVWQQFFTDRPSLLLALAYSVGVGLKAKCYVGGKGMDNLGGGVVDFIVRERGNATLIEIKSPTASLLGSEYRAGVWPRSRDVAGTCAQTFDYRSRFTPGVLRTGA